MYSQITHNKRASVVLVIVFIAVIAAIGWWLSVYANDSGIVVVAAVFAIVTAGFGYFQGDRVALALSHAQPANREDHAYVIRMVENLAITAGLPMPKTYIINDPAINAFATGRDPQHASIAVTTGAIERLENEELEGVLAHELSHVKNYDIRLMTLVLICAGFLAILSDLAWRSMWFGGDRDSRSSGPVAIIGFILIALSPIIAQLIKFAVSRRREFLADADGALLTRYPEGLARALEKIGQDSHQLRHATTATAHFYISNPLRAGRRLTALFSTHPPLEQRVAALRAMTR